MATIGNRQRLQRRQHPHDFLGLTTVREHQYGIIPMDPSQIPVDRFGRVQEVTAGPGGSQRGGDFLPHQPGFAHAADNHAAATMEQAIHRSTKGNVKLLRQLQQRLTLLAQDLAAELQLLTLRTVGFTADRLRAHRFVHP